MREGSACWKLFCVHAAASAVAKPKARFETHVSVKAMADNATTNTKTGKGLYLKSGDQIWIKGGVPPVALSWDFVIVAAA